MATVSEQCSREKTVRRAFTQSLCLSVTKSVCSSVRGPFTQSLTQSLCLSVSKSVSSSVSQPLGLLKFKCCEMLAEMSKEAPKCDNHHDCFE